MSNNIYLPKIPKYGYVYLTTNLTNQKKYIGQKTSTYFVKSYYGSGILLKKALKKYGSFNFQIEIIKWCYNKNDLNESEIYYIDKFDAINDDIYYNLTPGGIGGATRIGYKNSVDMNAKISQSNTGKKRTKIQNEKQSLRMLKTGNPNYNKSMSDEQKSLISKANLGHIVTEVTRNKISETKRNNTRPAWNKNKKYDIITCPYCSKKGGGPNMKRYHFNNCKFKNFAPTTSSVQLKK